MLTSDRSLITRKLDQLTEEKKQMTTALMNIQVTVGAVSHNTTDWQAINWPKVHRNVRRLQARIVKATQEGRWGKVKTLQHLLTRSFSGKALAVRRVTENRGKRTPGVDGEIWDLPTVRSVRKMLYLANRQITKKWTMPMFSWAVILNQLAIRFGDRFPL